MLLRESSRVLHQDVDLEAVIDPDSPVTDYGFPGGAELLGFATAASRVANGTEPSMVADLEAARRRVVSALGPEALVEAAATVAAFNGLVRVADGTGIELDDGMLAASADVRSDLKLDQLTGAANTRRLSIGRDLAPSTGPIESVQSLFADHDR